MQRIISLIDNNDIPGIHEYLTKHDKNHVNTLFTHDGKQETLLTYAMLRKNIDVINLLLSFDIDVSKENSNGDTAVSLATHLDSTAFSQFINHEKVKPHLSHISSVTKNTIVHDIILNNISRRSQFAFNIKIIKEMIEAVLNANNNIAINSPNDNSEVPINIIFDRFLDTKQRNASFTLLSELIKEMAHFPNFDINIFSASTGLTPLMIAAMNSDTVTAAVCSIPGVNIMLTNHLEESALHKAMRSNSFQIVSRLIRAGSNITPPNLAGETPLIIAGKQDAAQEFKALLSRLVKLKTAAGKIITVESIIMEPTFLHLIKETFSPNIINTILTVNSNLPIKCKLTNTAILDLLHICAEHAEHIRLSNPNRHNVLLSILHEITQCTSLNVANNGHLYLIEMIKLKREHAAAALINIGKINLSANVGDLTIVEFAEQSGMASIANLIKSHMASTRMRAATQLMMLGNPVSSLVGVAPHAPIPTQPSSSLIGSGASVYTSQVTTFTYYPPHSSSSSSSSAALLAQSAAQYLAAPYSAAASASHLIDNQVVADEIETHYVDDEIDSQTDETEIDNQEASAVVAMDATPAASLSSHASFWNAGGPSLSAGFGLSSSPIVRPLGSPSSRAGSSVAMFRRGRLSPSAAQPLAPHGIAVCPGRDIAKPSPKAREPELSTPASKKTC